MNAIKHDCFTTHLSLRYKTGAQVNTEGILEADKGLDSS